MFLKMETDGCGALVRFSYLRTDFHDVECEHISEKHAAYAAANFAGLFDEAHSSSSAVVTNDELAG
jgi:hypothetical protein